jgi:hypothetical protein
VPQTLKGHTCASRSCSPDRLASLQACASGEGAGTPPPTQNTSRPVHAAACGRGGIGEEGRMMVAVNRVSATRSPLCQRQQHQRCCTLCVNFTCLQMHMHGRNCTGAPYGHQGPALKQGRGPAPSPTSMAASSLTRCSLVSTSNSST